MRTLSLAAVGCLALFACGRQRASVGGDAGLPRVDGGSSSVGGGSSATGGGSASAGGAGGGSSDAGTTCNAATCANGCCTATGLCVTTTSNDRCGTGGTQCLSCSTGNTCLSRVCTPCAGCIDAMTGRCKVGFANDACGQGGQFCQSCTTGLTCTAAGRCMTGSAGGGSATAGGTATAGGSSGVGGGSAGGASTVGGGSAGGVSSAGGSAVGGGSSVAGGSAGGSAGGVSFPCNVQQIPPGGLTNNQLMPDGGLERLTGGLIAGLTATSLVTSAAGFPVNRVVDRDPTTSWFADTSTCNFVGMPEYCCQNVSLTVSFPMSDVSAVRLVGTREQPTGHDALSGWMIFLTPAGVEIGRIPFGVTRPDGDWGAVISNPLRNVGAIRLDFEWAEGSGPGLAEVEVYTPAQLPRVDGGFVVGTISWVQSAGIFRGVPGTNVSATCPPLNATGYVWGTDLYTDESSVCTAAVHAGVISSAGGAISFNVAAGQPSYAATLRNGVQSLPHAQHQGSFCFGTCLASDGGVPVYSAGLITWTTTAVLWPVVVSGVAEATCPAGIQQTNIWGTGIYTDDSAVCVAALHDGRITTAGGSVRLQVLSGQASYLGSLRNGITSSSWNAHPRSYSFLP